MPDTPTIRGVELAEVIGQGGFAVVYRGVQASFNRNVAVKVLQSTLQDDDARRRFQHECWAIGNVSDHPSIVSVYDSGVTEQGHPYLVMEFMVNGSMAEELKRRGTIPWKQAMAIAMKVGDALNAAHEAGIVHRDVKPENIMLTRKNEPQLGDFGIARIAGTERTKSGVITASLAYAAPEIFAGTDASPASDQYSLAATIDALIRGRAAFTVGNDESLEPLLARIVTQAPPSLDPWQVPDTVQRALHRAMAKRPADRYQSIEAFSTSLAQAADISATGGFVREKTALVKIDPAPITVLMPPGGKGTGGSGGASDPALAPPAWSREFQPAAPAGSITAGTTASAVTKGSSRRWLLPALAVLVLAGAGGAFVAFGGKDDSPPPAGPTVAPIETTIATTEPRTNPTTTPAPQGTAASSAGGSVAPSSAPPVVAGVPSGRGMVQIPAGTYPIGSAKPDLLAESSRRSIPADGFWIDEHEVTNAEYAQFVEKTGASPPLTGWTPRGPRDTELDHPVRAVNFGWATAYCTSLNKRLPTEAEWEIAAAGEKATKYAWGDDLAAVALPSTGTYAVKSVPGNKSSFGVYDLTGSVWEWVGDSYDPSKLAKGQNLLRGGQNGYVRNNWSRLPVDEKASNAVLGAGLRCAASKVSGDTAPGVFADYTKPPPPSVPVVTVPAGYRVFDDFSGAKLDWIEVTNKEGRFGYHPNKFFHLETKVPNHTVVALCPCTMPSGRVSVEVSAEVEPNLTEPAGTFAWGVVVRSGESAAPTYVPSEYVALVVDPRRQVWRAYAQKADGKQIELGSAQFNTTESDVVSLEVRDLGDKFEFFVNGTFRADAALGPAMPTGNHAGFILTSGPDSTKVHLHYGSFGIKAL